MRILTVGIVVSASIEIVRIAKSTTIEALKWLDIA